MKKKLLIIAVALLIIAIAFLGFMYRKEKLYLFDKSDERAYKPFSSSGFDSNSEEFNVEALLLIDETETSVEKIELNLAMEYDYIQYKGEDKEDYIIKTIDITDSIEPATKKDMKNVVLPDDSSYSTYVFDVGGTLTEDEGFDISRGMDYMIAITFSDGYVAELYLYS